MNIGVAYTKSTKHGHAISDATASGIEALGHTPIKIISKNNIDISGCKYIIQVCEYNKHLGVDLRYHIKRSKATRIIVDTGFVKNHRESGDEGHYSISLNGIKGEGDYRAKGSPSDRWDNLGVELKPWKEDGDYTLILGQQLGGISTQHININDILQQLIDVCADSGKVVFRPHPNQRGLPKRVIISKNKDIVDDLTGACQCISHSTNGIVDAVIEGVPSLNLSPYSILHCTPEPFDRRQTMYDLAYSQWTLEEMSQGIPYGRLIDEI